MDRMMGKMALGVVFVFVLAAVGLPALGEVHGCQPVGRWKFEEGPEGTTFLDTSGNHNHGTLSGDFAWSSDAPPGEAWSITTTSADFDAFVPDSGDTLDITDDFTIEAWLKLESGFYFVVKHQGHNDHDGSWHVHAARDESGHLVRVQMGALGNWTYAFSDWVPAPVSSWTHVAITYDDLENEAVFYVNGQPAGVRTVDWHINDTAQPVSFGYNWPDSPLRLLRYERERVGTVCRLLRIALSVKYIKSDRTRLGHNARVAGGRLAQF